MTSNLNFLLFKCIVFIITLISVKANIWRNGNIDRQSIGYGSNSQTFRHILKNLPAGANTTLIPLGQVLIPSGKEYLLCTKNGQPCNPNGANVFSGSMSSGYGSNMAGNGYGNNCCQSFNGNPYGQFGGNPYGNFMGNIGNSYMNNGGQNNGYGCTSQMGNQMSGDYSNSDYGNNCGGMDGCCLKKRRRRSFEQLCNLLAFNNID